MKVESAVTGVPDEKWGEVVKAFVVPKTDHHKVTNQELIDYCLSNGLPRYKMPRMIRFIESLPKNENGKIVKKELRNL